MSDIEELKQHYMSETEAASDLDALEAVRVAALGKKGAISELLKTLGRMSPEERQTQGPIIQGARGAVADAIAARKDALERAALDAQLAGERIDMSLPAPTSPQGSVHPVSQVMDELAEIFADLGFAVATGPEIETDWYNFTALNIPETHPARAEHDTFYTAEKGPGRQPYGAAHAHQPGADSHHDIAAPADPYHRAGPHLPVGQRRDAHADVSPGGGPGDRPRHPYGPSQMDAGDVRKGVFRARRHRPAPAPELFSVHRTLGRSRCRLFRWRMASA